MNQQDRKKIELFPAFFQALNASYQFADFFECPEIAEMVKTALDQAGSLLPPKPFQMHNKYPTTCSGCDRALPKGEMILYIPAEKKAICLECAKKKPSAADPGQL